MAKSSPEAATAKRKASPKQAVSREPTGAHKPYRASTPRAVKAPKKAAGIASTQRKDSKQQVVLGMLAAKDGATIDAIAKATHWQPHSVRGFFAGVVRKKLGLDLTSERIEGVRVYRIVSERVAVETARP